MYYKLYLRDLRDDYLARDFEKELDREAFFFILKNAARTFKSHLEKQMVVENGLVDVDDYAQESFLRFYAAKAAEKSRIVQFVAAKQGCAMACCGNFAAPARRDASTFYHLQEPEYDGEKADFDHYDSFNYSRVAADVFEDDDFREIAKDLVERFTETLSFNDRQIWILNLHANRDDVTRLCMISGKTLKFVRRQVAAINKKFVKFVLKHKHEYETPTFILGVPKDKIVLCHDYKTRLEKKTTLHERLKRYEQKKKTGKKLMLKGGLET